MTGLETILQRHLMTCYPGLVECDCGWQIEDDDSRESDHRMIAAHTAHVADQIRGWLLTDEVIEQAAAEFTRPEHGCDGTDAGCYEAGCPFPLHTVASDTELARAAITAALDTNHTTGNS